MVERKLVVILMLVADMACFSICTGQPASRPSKTEVLKYRLKMPDKVMDVRQASGLCYGRLGKREGLWLVCDRNSGSSGNKLHFIDKKSLSRARPEGTVIIDEAISIVPPAEGWGAFNKRHSVISRSVLARVRQQIDNGVNGRVPILDLEDITIGKSLGASQELHIFVVAEQPDSLVVELRPVERDSKTVAIPTNCYVYDEGNSARGDDNNDGLEGICWSGIEGVFYLVEEGTRPYKSTFTLLYFLEPRLVRCTLKEGAVVVDRAWSERVTREVWKIRRSQMQTLNAVGRIDERTLLAVDRNGGWILRVDLRSGRVSPWLNLYDPELLNLRERLAEFPGKRYLPYVSIEGLARDSNGDIWMVDDPAMPESFSQSCLIRLCNPPALGAD